MLNLAFSLPQKKKKKTKAACGVEKFAAVWI
jgi:hypothetical protein